jgi:NAD(P)H-hydrate epimerase
VGGSAGKTGAAVLAAEGAVAAGAGLVTVAHPESLGQIFEIKLTEAMTLGYADDGRACLGEAAVPELLAELQTRDVLVIGPGLGSARTTGAALEALLSASAAPAVVDADGLNAFADRPESLRADGARVLTPHPGEMARLLACATPEVQADRIGAARELARRCDAIVVLKGARTVIADPGGEVLVNPTGGPGLATGGTGDVLAGTIGALLGQGLGPFEAAGLGAYIHGRAGERSGLVGTAGSLATALPSVLAELRNAAAGDDGPGTLRRFS